MLRRIWKDTKYEGQGIGTTVVIPAAITIPQLQAIAAPPEYEDEEEAVMQVGKIAHKNADQMLY